MMKRLAALACFLSLAACGFTPVYGPAPEGSGPVQIVEISGRTGHFLRQELVRSLGRGIPGVSGESQLTVTLLEGIERLAFAPDTAASRSDYRVSATWVLRDPAGKLLMRGGVREAASFNFADAAYADVAAQSAAQERAALLVARSIRDDIIIAAGKPADERVAPAPSLLMPGPQLPQ
jgi:LPS-assembly lipoprotein